MSIILTTDEVAAVTGYRTPKRQLAELHRQGFYRAHVAAQRMGAHSTQAQTAAYIRNKKAIKSTATR